MLYLTTDPQVYCHCWWICSIELPIGWLIDNSANLVEFSIVLDLRDHTAMTRFRFKPPDGSAIQDKIAIVEALSHPHPEEKGLVEAYTNWFVKAYT